MMKFLSACVNIWYCFECHFRSGSRFKVCPNCGSQEVDNIG